jgi:hypothetical protein
MPVTTVETLRARESALKAKLREQGSSLDPARLRELKQRIRRVQRRRRRLVEAAERRAVRDKGEAKPEPAPAGS